MMELYINELDFIEDHRSLYIQKKRINGEITYILKPKNTNRTWLSIYDMYGDEMLSIRGVIYLYVKKNKIELYSKGSSPIGIIPISHYLKVSIFYFRDRPDGYRNLIAIFIDR